MPALSISAFTTTSAAVNFSTLTIGGKAVDDWVIPTGISTFQQKASKSILSERALWGDFGSGSYNGGATAGTTISWTSDGTPTASGSHSAGARNDVFNSAESNGWSFTCAVGTGERTIRVWVGRYCADTGADRFSITASISDGSSSDQTASIAGVTSDTDGYWDITVAAGSAGQTLTVVVKNNTTASGVFRTINLRGYWVSVESAGVTYATGNYSSSSSIRNQRTASYTATSSLRNFIGGSVTFDDQVLGFAVGSYSATSSIANHVNAAYTGTSSLFNYAVGTYNISSSVITYVAGNYVSDFDVRNYVEAEISLTYSIENYANGSFSGSNDVRNYVEGSYSVASSIDAAGFVSGSYSTASEIRNNVAATFTGSFDVNNFIDASFSADNTVLNYAASTFSSSASIRAFIDSSYSSSFSLDGQAFSSAVYESFYSIFNYASSSYTATFQVGAAAAQISKLDRNNYTEIANRILAGEIPHSEGADMYIRIGRRGLLNGTE